MLDSVHMSVDQVPQGLVARIKSESFTEREAGIVLEEFDAATSEAYDGAWSGIALDMSSVAFMASAGLGAVITINKRCMDHKAKLAVFGLNDELMTLLKMSKLHKLIPIVADEPAALKKIG